MRKLAGALGGAARRLSLVTVAIMAACGSAPLVRQPSQYTTQPLADTLPIWEPEQRKSSFLYDVVYQALFRPVGGGRNHGVPAWNVDARDDVAPSTWFQHRIATGQLSQDDLERGPRTTTGPDDSGPLTVWSIKVEGVTPGFWIQDASGVRWILKFDPPENQELASGAEVISTHLFWAAGYNTPENHIFYLDPDDLVLKDGLSATFSEGDSVARYAVGAGGAQELTMEIFRRNILDRYPRREGTIRALASRFLSGTPKGPFAYEGTRKDDPNDVIPHEHRRELRGLYVVAAWLNHIDARQGNTLDMYVPDPRSPRDGRRFGHLRHYLIDFGATLGSASVFPHNIRHGLENDLDLGAIGKRLVSLGAYRRPWENLGECGYPPAIGCYTIDNFQPGDWRPNFPNPAFDRMTPADGYWGAKIVAAFTDTHLEVATSLADYSDPAAANYLLDGLKARRDATVRFWFSQVTPLERPRIEGDEFIFDDEWVSRFGGSAEYRYRLEWQAPDPDLEIEGRSPGRRISLLAPGEALVLPEDPAVAEYARLEVWRRTPPGEWSPRPATFWLAWDDLARTWRVLGLHH